MDSQYSASCNSDNEVVLYRPVVVDGKDGIRPALSDDELLLHSVDFVNGRALARGGAHHPGA